MENSNHSKQRIGKGKKSTKMKKRKYKSKTKSSLFDKVKQNGGISGYALEDHSHDENSNTDGDTSMAPKPKLKRIFATPSNTNTSKNQSIKNPYLKRDIQFTFSSAPRKQKSRFYKMNNNSTRISNNKLSSKFERNGNSRHRKKKNGGDNKKIHRTHLICSISENMARETCVSSLDAGLPVEMQVTKQANGQTYTETISYLDLINPNEILLNEGRRNSQLAVKVMKHFRDVQCDVDLNDTTRSSSMECSTSVVIKFLPRHYFDQTRGAELLRNVCIHDSYDPSVMEEYIILASSHAVLQYAQLCLGASFAKNCLSLKIDSGGHNRMSIDRSSLHHLELLRNAKTGKIQNSLVGTIDCTKTSVGARLLRTNIMAPPSKIQTIDARLDLVDIFLEDEDFFYTVMEHLEALPDINKMLSHMALIPKAHTRAKDVNNQNHTTITARIASKGISALVCIKSALSALPSLVSEVETKLEKLDKADKSNEVEEQSTTMGTESPSQNTCTSECSGDRHRSVSPSSPLSRDDSRQNHQLLRTILMSLHHPALEQIYDAVTNIFTKSTTYSRNSHAMRHQECFALKPNTDGMMDVLRKAFLANVDDIYRLADEYTETLGFNVRVKETSSRGYYLCVPGDISSNLPSIFIQPVKSGKFINCTTEEVSFTTRCVCHFQS